MPTRSGWFVLLVGTASLIAARIVGYLELWILGVTCVGLVVAALVLVRSGRFPLAISRQLRPSRVRAGQPGAIELVIVNRSRRRSSTIALTESVGSGPPALVHVAPLAPRERVGAAYQLPTSGRGRIQVGPLRALVRDPLKLASRTLVVAPVSGLTVHPEPIDIGLSGVGLEGRNGIAARSSTGTIAFAGLREYSPGDDLRRVHWRATARHGDLLIRLDDDERDAARTVLLDARPGLYTPGRFDQAAAAALSLCDAGVNIGAPIRLVTTSGLDTGVAGGPAQLDRCGDELAVVTEQDGSLLAALEVATAGRDDLVVVTGRIGRGDLDLIAARAPFGTTVVTTGPVDTPPAGLKVVVLPEPAPIQQTARPRTRQRRRPPTTSLGLLEIALVALTVVTLLSARRVFSSWDYLWPTLIAAAVGHGIAMATRRLRWPVIPSLAVSALVLAMVGAAIRYPATTRYGIPTRLTWDSFEFEVRTAVTAIENVIAPVEPIAGFLTIAVLAALVMPVLADAFAIRARAAFESLTPALAVCAVLAVLGIDEYRVTTTVAILGAAIGVLAAHRRWTTRMDGGWLANRPVTVPSTTGALAVGAMLLASAVVAPRLPWADDTPLIDVEASASSKLVTVSPLVELQAQLTGERSNRTVMRVRTNAPNYLRLTSLESFDGRRWEGERSFGRAGGNLTDVGDGVDISASITLVNYGGRYVPTPYVPTRLDTTDDVRLQFDDDSSTVRIDSGTITNYDVTAVGLNPTAEQLAVATSEDAPDAYYELPDATDPAITAATRDIVGEGSTGLQMRRLQDYFRTFDYDVSIQVPRDVDPVLWFLDARRGFCQQFSGAFAVMARSIGVPARVAVGFTPGELAPNGTYTVAGRHAHAWPEVWFDDIGWVAFEPTPGRGLPDQFGAHTGVPQQQAGDDVPATPVTTTTSAPQSSTTAPSQAATATTRPNFDRGLDDGGAALGRQTADESTFPWAPVVLAGGALVGGLVWWKREQLGLRWRRWRRWRRASSAPDRVRAAWGDVLDAAASRGVHASGPDTDRVVAAQIQARLVPGDKVTRLVRLAEFAAFSGTASEADVAEATDLSARMTALILDAPPTVPGLRASEPATP